MTVLHVPHASTFIPDDIRPSLLLDDQALTAELLAMTDHLTDRLFSVDGAVRVVYAVSRLVVDPERFYDDGIEPMAARGMGVIYELTSTGARLRERPDPEQREDLLQRFYHPHHEALADAVDAELEATGGCLLFDCHSFPARARTYELNPGAPRPEICLGTDNFHTPARLRDRAREAFAAEGFWVEVDRPYRGTLVPGRHYAREARVASLMVEVNRGLYLDESTGGPSQRYEEVRSRLGAALARIASA